MPKRKRAKYPGPPPYPNHYPGLYHLRLASPDSKQTERIDSIVFGIRCTREEKAFWVQQAAEEQLTLNSFIRKRMNKGARIATIVNAMKQQQATIRLCQRCAMAGKPECLLCQSQLS